MKKGHPGCWYFARHCYQVQPSCPHNILVLLRGKVLLMEEILQQLIGLFIPSFAGFLYQVRDFFHQQYGEGKETLRKAVPSTTLWFWRILGLWTAPNLMGKYIVPGSLPHPIRYHRVFYHLAFALSGYRRQWRLPAKACEPPQWLNKHEMKTQQYHRVVKQHNKTNQVSPPVLAGRHRAFFPWGGNLELLTFEPKGPRVFL